MISVNIINLCPTKVYATKCCTRCYGFFLSFRERFIESYPEIFGQGGQEQADYSSAANFGSKWGWYQSVYRLAGGEVLNFDKATNIPAHQAMIFLSFEKEKNELEAKLIKN